MDVNLPLLYLMDDPPRKNLFQQDSAPRDEEEESEQISENARCQKEYSSDEDHEAVHQVGSGYSSFSHLLLDLSKGRESLRFCKCCAGDTGNYR